MTNDPLKAAVLAVRIIPNATKGMLKELEISERHTSLGIFTADSDDVAYVALDEATKKADVKVVYAKSFYGGAANANTKLAGEVIGIVSASNPEEIRTALDTICHTIENGAAHFVSANQDDSIAYFSHLVSRSGSYLSKIAGVAEGSSLAYLIAPPLEAMYGLDAALKAANVKIAVFFGPPSETNFGGALLTGSLSSCQAACDAFSSAVLEVAQNPGTSLLNTGSNFC